jgi:hypothetical protein
MMRSRQVEPIQAKPNEVKSNQVKPSQAKPSQAKPSQAKPSQAKSSRVKPSQVKHLEHREHTTDADGDERGRLEQLRPRAARLSSDTALNVIEDLPSKDRTASQRGARLHGMVGREGARLHGVVRREVRSWSRTSLASFVSSARCLAAADGVAPLGMGWRTMRESTWWALSGCGASSSAVKATPGQVSSGQLRSGHDMCMTCQVRPSQARSGRAHLAFGGEEARRLGQEKDAQTEGDARHRTQC